jgi:Bacterial lipid A biosynthesis acyltransferase
MNRKGGLWPKAYLIGGPDRRGAVAAPGTGAHWGRSLGGSSPRFLGRQDPRKGCRFWLSRGVAVPFFGRVALTAPAVAVAAAKTSIPVHFLEYWREGIGRHHAAFSAPLPVTGRVEDDVAAFTARIEEAVRRRPHNWFWLHDRWKGAPAASP